MAESIFFLNIHRVNHAKVLRHCKMSPLSASCLCLIFCIPSRQAHYPSFVSFEPAPCAACMRAHTRQNTASKRVAIFSLPPSDFIARRGLPLLLHSLRCCTARNCPSALLCVLQCKLGGVVCHPTIGGSGDGSRCAGLLTNPGPRRTDLAFEKGLINAEFTQLHPI